MDSSHHNRKTTKSQDPLHRLTEEIPSLIALALSTFGVQDGPVSAEPAQVGFKPASETYSEGEDFVLRLELPGVNSETLSIELVEGRVVVSGEKTPTVLPPGAKKTLHEIRYGKFKRAYGVAGKPSPENVDADFKNGVLTVRVKQALKKPETIKINVATD